MRCGARCEHEDLARRQTLGGAGCSCMILQMNRNQRPAHEARRELDFDNGWTRRRFLSSAAISAASLALSAPSFGSESQARATGPAPLRGRFVTHVSIVRVNQIEVTPTRNIGEDEVADNRPELIRARRDAFARGCPDGKMTWAISWLALNDNRDQYKEARRLLASYHDRYGDEVTFLPGGYFAPMYDTRENNRKTIHEALGKVSALVGGGYRPQCLIAGFMDAENQRLLAADEGIHVCQGQIWSQHGNRQRRWRWRNLLSLLPQPRALSETRARVGRFRRLRLPGRLDLRFPGRPAGWFPGRFQQPDGRGSHRDSGQPWDWCRPQGDDGYDARCTSTPAIH